MAEHTDTRTTARSGHPIEAFLRTVLHDLQGLAEVPTWSMDAETTIRVVALAAQVSAGVAEVEARTIAQAEVLDLPASAQCRDVARWITCTTGVTRRTTCAKARLAASPRDLEATRVATARGDVHTEQARAIADQIALLDDQRASAHDDMTEHRAAGAYVLRRAPCPRCTM